MIAEGQGCPAMDEHCFIFKDVLEVNPKNDWKFCKMLQMKWEKELSLDSVLADKMKYFRKVSAVLFVWVADKLGGNLPTDVSMKDTYRSLLKLYDSDSPINSAEVTEVTETNNHDHHHHGSKNAETDRTTKIQLEQAFFALNRLLNAAADKQDLSEELIRAVHKELMTGLNTDQGETINAGGYRTGPVSAGNHSFPDHNCIPKSMKTMIKKYNDKLKKEHDMFELASWLLYQFVSLHPFEDGNGRMCRLLWCFSLLRGGLPFPLTIYDGHAKAHKHYVICIDKDRNQSHSSSYPCLNSLSVVSIKKKWENFINNLQFECPEKYEEIRKWQLDTIEPIYT